MMTFELAQTFADQSLPVVQAPKFQGSLQHPRKHFCRPPGATAFRSVLGPRLWAREVDVSSVVFAYLNIKPDTYLKVATYLFTDLEGGSQETMVPERQRVTIR